MSTQSALQAFRAALQKGAVFTVEWPSPSVVRGNVGSSALLSPPALRSVSRATSTRAYFTTPDGKETPCDFPKAHLIEQRADGAFVFYDPAYSQGGGALRELPGERGPINRIYHVGDKTEELTTAYKIRLAALTTNPAATIKPPVIVTMEGNRYGVTVAPHQTAPGQNQIVLTPETMTLNGVAGTPVDAVRGLPVASATKPETPLRWGHKAFATDFHADKIRLVQGDIHGLMQQAAQERPPEDSNIDRTWLSAYGTQRIVSVERIPAGNYYQVQTAETGAIRVYRGDELEGRITADEAAAAKKAASAAPSLPTAPSAGAGHQLTR